MRSRPISTITTSTRPIQNIQYCGVSVENVGEFIKAGAYATAAGSSLVDAKSLKEKNWAAITAKAKAFVAAVAAVK